jgi:proteasome assembly chaperone (PAC2) family protein
MWNKLQVLSEPGSLRDPILLVSVSTSNPQFRLLYSQARELGKVLIRKLAFKQIATFYASAMSPEIRILRNGTATLQSNNFYHYAGENRDYILFAGHSSPIESEYEYAEVILDYARNLGVKELISFGARWSEPVLSPLEPPKVLGFATDEIGVNKLKEAGVTILKSEAAFYFANLIVPLAKLYGIRGFKLSVDHGEPSPHPKSLISLLTVLSKMIDLKVDQTDLLSQSKELAEAIQKAEVEGVEIDEDGEPTGTNKRSQQSDDIYR